MVVFWPIHLRKGSKDFLQSTNNHNYDAMSLKYEFSQIGTPSQARYSRKTEVGATRYIFFFSQCTSIAKIEGFLCFRLQVKSLKN